MTTRRCDACLDEKEEDDFFLESSLMLLLLFLLLVEVLSGGNGGGGGTAQGLVGEKNKYEGRRVSLLPWCVVVVVV